MSVKSFCDYSRCKKEISNVHPRIIRISDHENNFWMEYCEEHRPTIWKEILGVIKR